MKRVLFLKPTSFSFQPLIKFRSLVISSSSQIVSDNSLHSLDVNSLNRMIISLSRSGDLGSARRLFDQMPERDVVSWNSIMTAYTQHGHFDEVIGVFAEMHRSRLGPNSTSFSTALTSCAKLRGLMQGRQIHGLSIKLRSSENVFVGSSLITMYAKCNMVDGLCWILDGITCLNLAAWNALISGYVSNRRISDARKVFDRMPNRNVVSWTAMINGYIKVEKLRTALELFNLMPNKNPVTWSVILGGLVSNEKYVEALELFARMMYEGIQSNAPSIVNVISACSRMKSLNSGRRVHGYVIKLGFHVDQIIEASLVCMYCECLSIEEAKLEFDKMETKFTGSLNSLIHGYINNNRIDEARTLFDIMDARDKISWNLMVTGYLKSNRTDDALELFSKMPEPTLESITALMHSFTRNGRIDEAQKLFNMMPQGDAVAYTTLIFGYLKEGQLDKVMKLFDKMPERNVVTFNVMISGFLHHGKASEAYKLFNMCPDKDSITWDALIAGYVQNGLHEQAIQLYRKMLLTDISPSELVMTSLLRSSSKLSLLILGKQLHTVSIKLALDRSLVIRNSLINMYCKSGNMHIAKLIFDQMVNRDVVTWNAMIYGYALHGLGEEAIETFHGMERAMVRPDDVTFLGVLSACNHKCLLEEAQHHFNSMRDYGIIPTLPHYTCMVDLLCRMGMVEEAKQLVSSMPYEPDSVIWTSLLSGCRLNGNVELAEYAANQLFTWDPMDRMPYLHLLSIYGSAGRWDDMEILRIQLNKIGSKKQHGFSWI
nr:pentatricopeptide repeat protein AaPPR1185 [Agave angustifolia]